MFIFMTLCCFTSQNPLNIDNDGDGFTEFEGDCNDNDPAANLISSDNDCDGYERDDDCDDYDPSSTHSGNDYDCDGVVYDEDCNDNDIEFGAIENDQDCDGALTSDDCDDNDPNILGTAFDNDCDGIPSTEDCDDNDPTTLNDMDCDGVPSSDDCDDNNPIMPNNDQDCDGAITSEDCNDQNPLINAECCENAQPEQYNNHSYIFCPGGVRLVDAFTLCEEMGGFPVKIEDEEENDWIRTMADRYIGGQTGIGLNSIEDWGNWLWADNTPVGSFFPKRSESDWLIQGIECAVISTIDGFWDSKHCNLIAGYVCEIE